MDDRPVKALLRCHSTQSSAWRSQRRSRMSKQPTASEPWKHIPTSAAHFYLCILVPIVCALVQICHVNVWAVIHKSVACCRNAGVEGAQEAFRAVSEAYEVHRAFSSTFLHLTAASPSLRCAPPGLLCDATTPAPQVLRDERKRAAYDAQRRGSSKFGTGSPAAAASGAWRPGASDFDEAFASWFERQGCAPRSTAAPAPRAFIVGGSNRPALVKGIRHHELLFCKFDTRSHKACAPRVHAPS